MAGFPKKRILADNIASDFIGRAGELERILQHAKKMNGACGLILSSAPGSGASELLKQAYDKLFSEPINIVPFYFSFNKQDKTALGSARRFAYQLLLQTVAFRHNDPTLLAISPDVSEIAELAIPSDVHWIDRVIKSHNSQGDERVSVRNAFSSPLRAAANGAKVFVMIDDLHLSADFGGGIDLAAELRDIFCRSEVPFIFAGRRRFLSNEMPFERFEFDPLSFQSAGDFVAHLANKSHIKINDHTRDVIVTQFSRNANSIKSFLQAAAHRDSDLDSLQKVEQLYADELFGGFFGKFYDSLFHQTALNIEVEKKIIGLLHEMVTTGNEKTSIATWEDCLGVSGAEFSRIMDLLNIYEIVRISSNRIEAMSDNEVLTDYLKVRFRLEDDGETRALVFGELLSVYLKRAPQIMARLYRQNSTIGLRDLMSTFAAQDIPTALIDYSRFAEEYKGTPDEEILDELQGTAETIKLPQIVFATQTADVYKPIEMVSEKGSSAFALGFQEKRYTDEDEIAWIAAQIDSKLEASMELTGFWCDRLEMVALMCNLKNFKIWLIATEGFSPEAMNLLRDRGFFGSSNKQVDLLKRFLKTNPKGSENPNQHEYEMVVPMGEEAELIAAHAVEDIAKRHHFGSKAINQIKTALVEACINASEHSLSPDQKIYQKFAVDGDRLTITISNRGLRLNDKKAVEIEPDEGRRGWGLKLMKKLMDEVKIEETDDGTSISMTKYLKPV